MEYARYAQLVCSKQRSEGAGGPPFAIRTAFAGELAALFWVNRLHALEGFIIAETLYFRVSDVRVSGGGRGVILYPMGFLRGS